MKIRTDFVTNSSGSNTVEIKIENPLLLEILNNYKSKGLLNGNKRKFYTTDFIIGSIPEDSSHQSTSLREGSDLKLYISDEVLGGYGITASLEHVLDLLFQILDKEWNTYLFDKDIYHEMKAEILSRKDEVNKNFSKVSWLNRSLNADDADQFEYFTYDRENGESYLVDTEYYNHENFED